MGHSFKWSIRMVKQQSGVGVEVDCVQAEGII